MKENNNRNAENAEVKTFNLLHSIADNGYFCMLDADDEYALDFLKKMIGFMEQHDLDAAMCGYDFVHGGTGELLHRKVLDEDLILASDEDFVEKFMEYRPYCYETWGRVFRLKPLKKACADNFATQPTWGHHELQLSFKAFDFCERVGILAESLHKYYTYPDSLSKRFNPASAAMARQGYYAAKIMLLRRGPMKKLNQDYLYAVYMGQIEQSLALMHKADISLEEKMEFLAKIFGDPVMRELTIYEGANPQFNNLARFDDFVRESRQWVRANGGNDEEIFALRPPRVV